MSTEDRIRWNCPHCDQLYKTPIEKAGESAICLECGAELTVPTVDPPPAEAEPEEARLRWSCSQCDLTFQTSPSLAGQIIECPSCQTATPVPTEPDPTAGNQ